MAINVKVSSRERVQKVFELDIRKTLNGDLMIFDHTEIDIYVLRDKKKVITFAKESMSDLVYGAQNRLFEYLKRKGVVAFDSIQGGNVYGSIEGVLNESKEKDVFKILLFEISEWIKTEKPFTDYDQDVEDAYLNPDQDDSTELGEVPHAEEKGSIKQHQMHTPYLYGRYSY